MTAGSTDTGRREFFRLGAAAGGALVLALTLPAFGGSERRKSQAGTADGGTLNAWLKIGTDDSITVIVDRSEMGQGVYTALPMLLAEELEVDLARIRVVAAPVGDVYTNALNGGQITGTSNSVQDAWEKLRTAGAQARMMLIAAAAQRWRANPADCHAANGAVSMRDGKSLSYGKLAESAAKLPVPKKVTLKSAAEFRLVGKPLARLDTPDKVDGSAEFGIDVKLPGMLYAAVAQCPTLGGKAAAIDSAVAASMPGVRKVLPTEGAVVVIADHYWQALQARNALNITWNAGANARLDNAAMFALLEQKGRTSAGLSARKEGNAAAALKSAKRTLDAVYELPLLAHATMEPMNCTADVKTDRCDIYVGTQVQKSAQDAAAAAAGLPAAQVDVHTTLLGGGFGRRLEVDFIPAAVAASKAVGAPVKLIWTREDDMTHDPYRPPIREQLSGGLDAAGKLVAWRLHIISPFITGRFAPDGTDPFDSVVEYAAKYPYAVPNFALDYSRQEVGIDVGYLRSVSHAPNCFAIECFMDELAAAAGQDPLAFRLSLLGAKPRHATVLKMAAERAGWGSPAPGRHLGIALMEGYDTCVAQVADVSIGAGGLKVHKITCALDCGQMINPRIVESQVESAIVFGLTAALWGEISLKRGQVQQRNFNSYRLLRSHEMPELDVHLVQSAAAPGGIGEAGVGPLAPAICNAIFAATGKRVRSLPISAHELT